MLSVRNGDVIKLVNFPICINCWDDVLFWAFCCVWPMCVRVCMEVPLFFGYLIICEQWLLKQYATDRYAICYRQALCMRWWRPFMLSSHETCAVFLEFTRSRNVLFISYLAECVAGMLTNQVLCLLKPDACVQDQIPRRPQWTNSPCVLSYQLIPPRYHARVVKRGNRSLQPKPNTYHSPVLCKNFSSFSTIMRVCV